MIDVDRNYRWERFFLCKATNCDEQTQAVDATRQSNMQTTRRLKRADMGRKCLEQSPALLASVGHQTLISRLDQTLYVHVTKRCKLLREVAFDSFSHLIDIPVRTTQWLFDRRIDDT
jgi:hypothetical protein